MYIRTELLIESSYIDAFLAFLIRELDARSDCWTNSFEHGARCSPYAVDLGLSMMLRHRSLVLCVCSALLSAITSNPGLAVDSDGDDLSDAVEVAPASRPRQTVALRESGAITLEYRDRCLY